jgi:hypothetical protein
VSSTNGLSGHAGAVLTGAAALLCALYVWGFWSWFAPPAAVALGVLLLAAGVFALWPLWFARAPGVPPRRAAAGEDTRQVAALREDFEALGFTEGVEQLRMLEEKYRNLAEVLGLRLQSGELTHRRYLGTAERVYLAAIENLQDVAILMRSISTIDPAALALRLKDLKQRRDFPVPEAIQAIEDRRRLYEEQRRRIATLLAQTEAAMTALDRTSAALAGSRTGKGLTEVAIEDAMRDLAELAGRAGDYAGRASVPPEPPSAPWQGSRNGQD